MKTFYSKWNNFDLREREETNKLYDIVEYYGGYLWYRDNVNQGAFEKFYNNTYESMKNIFINRANAEVKKHLSTDICCISGRKMKRLLITGHNKRIVSYEWITDYVEYILNECLTNGILADRVTTIIRDSCIYCIGIEEKGCRIVACTRRVLGFQYDLLDVVSRRGNTTAQKANRVMEKITSNNFWENIVLKCNIN